MTARIFEGYYLTSDGRITRFGRNEIACRCGCGLDEMREETIDALHAARTEFGHPMVPTSGCRCATHNTAVGGTDNSAHLIGLAADLQSTVDLYTLYLILTKHFRRVCVYSQSQAYFCHADMRVGGPRIWDVVTRDGKFLWTEFLEHYKIGETDEAINGVLEAT